MHQNDQGELPDVAAARRRLRARRPRRHRPDHRAARQRQRRPGRLPARPLADARRKCATRMQQRARRRKTSAGSTRDFADAESDVERDPVSDRATSTSGTRESTYIQEPPFFDDFGMAAGAMRGHQRRAAAGDLRRLRDDRPHQPGRRDQADARRPASTCIEHGVAVEDFNSYGSRRGNDRVMTRGTFANVRIKNLMVPGVEGGVTVHQPDGERMSIYDAAMKYSGRTARRWSSSPARSTAPAARATGPRRARSCSACTPSSPQSFERIHRSQPRRHGRAPAAVQGRHERRRRSASTAPRPSTSPASKATLRPRQDADAAHPPRRRHDGRGRRSRVPHRHADRGRLLRARRHPAVRAAAVDGRGVTRSSSRPVFRSPRGGGESQSRTVSQSHRRSGPMPL